MKQTIRKYFLGSSLSDMDDDRELNILDIVWGIVIFPFFIMFLPFGLIAIWLNKK